MFNLTKQEQKVVAFLAGAVLLGIAVREWRLRHPRPPVSPVVEAKGK
jgi:hypothetical protein